MNTYFETICFSKDRPLQLDLTIKTFKKNNKTDVPLAVIYKATSELSKSAYKNLQEKYFGVNFIEEKIFKVDLLKELWNVDKVLFVVDDTIFTQEFNTNDICAYLSTLNGALGFSLRLGENTTYCYPENKPNEIPDFIPLPENINAFNWAKGGTGDFYYPLELSSSVYRVDDVLPVLESTDYSTPNGLEWNMSLSLSSYVSMPFLLSYKTSVAFANPLNKVQHENNNRAGNNPSYTVENLLDYFLAGLRANPNQFQGFVSNACHQEIPLEFINED